MIVIAFGLFTVFTQIFKCIPLQKNWMPTTSSRCLPENLSYYYAAVNIATDVVVCVLPLPLLKTLRLPKKQKRVLLAVFALGGL